jgi:hypothetical protein
MEDSIHRHRDGARSAVLFWYPIKGGSPHDRVGLTRRDGGLCENSFVATGQRVPTPDLTHALVVEVGGDRFAVGVAGPNGRGSDGDQVGRTSEIRIGQVSADAVASR